MLYITNAASLLLESDVQGEVSNECQWESQWEIEGVGQTAAFAACDTAIKQRFVVLSLSLFND